MCRNTTQLLRVTYTFYSQVNSTFLRCPSGNANRGYTNLASMRCQKKISTSFSVAIILVYYKRHQWTVQLRYGVSGKNTQFSGLLTGLCAAVKPCNSVKSYKMLKTLMLYNGAISNKNGVAPSRNKVLSIPSSSAHIKYVKYVNYVYSHGM